MHDTVEKFRTIACPSDRERATIHGANWPVSLVLLAAITTTLLAAPPAARAQITTQDIEIFSFFRADPAPGTDGLARFSLADDAVVVELGREIRFGGIDPDIGTQLDIETTFGEPGVDSSPESLEIQIYATVPRAFEDFECLVFNRENRCVKAVFFVPTVTLSAAELPIGVELESRGCFLERAEDAICGFGGCSNTSPFTAQEQDLLRSRGASNVLEGCAATLRWDLTNVDADDVARYRIPLTFDLLRLGILQSTSSTSTVTAPFIGGSSEGPQQELDLTVTDVSIANIELTQAIQTLQTVDELRDSINGPEGEPPVPLVAGKPLAIRVYPAQSSRRTRVEGRIAIVDPETGTGFIETIPQATLTPNCTPRLRRLRSPLAGSTAVCRSLDLKIPEVPEGVFPIHVLLQSPDGRLLARESLPVPIREESDELVLEPVAVCDAVAPNGIWLCEPAGQTLRKLTGLLGKLAPTNKVTIGEYRGKVTGRVLIKKGPDTRGDEPDGNDCYDRNLIPVPFNHPDAYQCEPKIWWSWVLSEIQKLNGFYERNVADLLGREIVPYGLARPEIFKIDKTVAGRSTRRNLLNRRAAASVSRIDNGTTEQDFGDRTEGILVHEVGHAFFLQHTNLSAPRTNSSPGCWGRARQPGLDSPFPDNRIRSKGPSGDTPIEVGFDFETNRPVNGFNHFDIMSYCAPMWISPRHYGGLADGEERALSERPGDFWLFSGLFTDDALLIDPVFSQQAIGPVETGEGDLSIEVRDELGALLYERRFDPLEVQSVTLEGDDDPPTLLLSELVPVQAAAATIDILGPSRSVLASLGSSLPPTVTIQNPAGGELLSDVFTVGWTGSDPEGAALSYWLQFSSDSGQTWQSLGQGLRQTEFPVDFGDLPGADGTALIRVLASDGLATATAVSAPFSVPRSPPEAEILHPVDGQTLRSDDIVFLRGFVYDKDDTGDNATLAEWISSSDGVLGEGETLAVSDLSVGEHDLFLVVTDGEGNQANDSVHIEITDEPVVEETIANDADDDGIPAGEDCDDGNPGIFPGAPERLNNGIDEDCDGHDAIDTARLDADGDGLTPAAGDCDDTNPLVFAGAIEIAGNGVDENCDGADLLACDVDLDGRINLDDIGLIMTARNSAAFGTDDTRDADGDGFITVLDARRCVLACDNPGCAP